MKHNMTIQYETVKYATGFVNNINPKGFTDIHYDKVPSPLGVFGGGVLIAYFSKVDLLMRLTQWQLIYLTEISWVL